MPIIVLPVKGENVSVTARLARDAVIGPIDELLYAIFTASGIASILSGTNGAGPPGLDGVGSKFNPYTFPRSNVKLVLVPSPFNSS